MRHARSSHRLALFPTPLFLLFAVAAFWLGCASAQSQNLYVANGGGTTVGEYNAATGATINASFITGLSQPRGVLISGDTLYVADDGTSNTIRAYNATTGTLQVGFSTISGLNNPEKMLIIGSNLYVVNFSGTVGVYNALTGAVINATLISGLSASFGIAASGNTLYVDDYNNTRINEYDAATGVLSPNSIIATGSIYDIAVSGSALYAANGNTQGVDKFDLSTGAIIAKPFMYGAYIPRGLAILNNALYVTDASTGTVEEFNLSTGAAINSHLVSGLNDPRFLAVSVIPEPSTWMLLGTGTVGLGVALRHRSRA